MLACTPKEEPLCIAITKELAQVAYTPVTGG